MQIKIIVYFFPGYLIRGVRTYIIRLGCFILIMLSIIRTNLLLLVLLKFDLEFTKVIDDGIDKFYRALHDEQLNFLPAQQLRTCAFNFTGWKKTVGAL